MLVLKKRRFVSENDYKKAKLEILKTTEKISIVILASIKDKKMKSEISLMKLASEIRELKKRQDLKRTKKDNNKHAPNTCVDKKGNETENFSKDGQDHYKQKLKEPFRSLEDVISSIEYEDRAEKNDHSVSFIQSAQNKIANRNDEQQPILKTEYTSVLKHLQKEKVLLQILLTENIFSLVDLENDMYLPEGATGGCGKFEDSSLLVALHTYMIYCLEGVTGGCGDKFEQSSDELQHILLKCVKLRQTQVIEYINEEICHIKRKNKKLVLECMATELQDLNRIGNVVNARIVNVESCLRSKSSENTISNCERPATNPETLMYISSVVKRRKRKCFETKSKNQYAPLSFLPGINTPSAKNPSSSPEFFEVFCRRIKYNRVVFIKSLDVLLTDISHQRLIEMSQNEGKTTAELPVDFASLNQQSEVNEDEELSNILQQDEEVTATKKQHNKKPVYRLYVVTAEVFEQAMRQYQIENYEITHTNYFPNNCRMFLHIPVLKGGFINRRDMKDRR